MSLMLIKIALVLSVLGLAWVIHKERKMNADTINALKAQLDEVTAKLVEAKAKIDAGKAKAAEFEAAAAAFPALQSSAEALRNAVNEVSASLG